MIKTEAVTINGKTFYKTYSDAGYLIHGGSPEGDYAEATDPVQRTYTETTTKIQPDEELTDADYAEAGKILLGVSGGDE